jgi:hypothetical protein
MCFPGLDDFIVVKPLRAMVAVAEQERIIVPGIDQRRVALAASPTAIARLIAALPPMGRCGRVLTVGQRRASEPGGREQRQCHRHA